MAAALVLSLGVTGLLSACGASPETLSSDIEDTSDDIEIEEQLENEEDEIIDDTVPADSEVSGEETPVTDNTSSVNQKTSDTSSQKADAKTKAAAPASSANTNSGTTSKTTTNTPAAASSDTQKSAENKTVKTETPAQNTTTTSEPARTYKNGPFSGSGTGYAGPISVSVTIKDDVITAISVTSSSDDEPFISDAKGVISKMLSAQSANVDTVSGATYSSKGIISAVKSALASAKN
jgi:uncharacterized protein with FMN-binding domain